MDKNINPDRVLFYTSTRRITNEFKNNNKISYFNFYFLNNQTNHKFVNFEYNNYNITIKFDKSYPFRPPISTIINNKNIDFTKIPDRLEKYLREINKDKCPHCNSITCHYNWGPSYKLLDIINEYTQMKDTILIIRNLIHYEKQLFNNLPDELIRIIKEYLFR